MHGHAAHDDMKYVPKEQVEEWRKKDPIDLQERRLREAGVDTTPLREEIRAAIEEGTQAALAMAMPDPASATDRLFHDGPDEILLGDGNAPWSGFAEGGS
jgi:TPP-dependent pyruvate/acetoin dehydrogenase alpha subunit